MHHRQKDGSRQEVPCPEAIIRYNKYMGGVERGDQLWGYYRCRVKSRKFYKYIFYFLLDVAITNTYVLYNGWSPRPQAVKCMKLAHELIGDYCTRCHAGRVGSSLVPLPLLPSQSALCYSLSEERGRCAYCNSVHNKRTYAQWFCRECDKWLCHSGYEQSDCFLLWHKRRLRHELQ